MAQVTFSGSSGTIPNLNQNFTQLYDLRELISTPGYTAASPRLAVDALGNTINIGGGGLGYGAGSGGAVTQATSKSTGVTLNKPSGQITMNGASLAAATNVNFALTNSLIAATDVVVLSIGGGVGADGNYSFATHPAAGGCTISVRNVSAGALAEAVVLNFAVIKAAIT